MKGYIDMGIKESISELRQKFDADLSEVRDSESIEKLRVSYLGKKGSVTELLKGLKDLSGAEKKEFGQTINTLKREVDERITAHVERIRQEEEDRLVNSAEQYDVTLPMDTDCGSYHPITLVQRELEEIFASMGFTIEDYREVVTDYNCFEALNIPKHHPARDMQDTLYITERVLMRTHTSPVQVRTMLGRKPPLAIVAPGKVYRRDSDLTHTPMFHQVEGLVVGQNISMAHLRGTLTAFVRSVFGGHTEVRFRPSFFPFTEPSAEVDISCCMCGGKGHINGEPCRVCKTTGWVEILGCGMVDPAVFASVGYPADVSGFAFGLGVERVAMLKYGIGDLRMFFENDVRFLGQFGLHA